MKKNYIQPNIKMAIAMETEEMIATSMSVHSINDGQIESADAILSRRENSIWGDEEE